MFGGGGRQVVGFTRVRRNMDDDNAMQVDTDVQVETGIKVRAHVRTGTVERASTDVQGTQISTTENKGVEAMHKILNLFRENLDIFILPQLKRALGKDDYERFKPEVGASDYEMMKYLQKRWIAVFSDSPLKDHERLVERLLKVFKIVIKPGSKRRNGAKLSPEAEDKLDEVGALIKAFLMIIAPTQAARVTDILESVEHKKRVHVAQTLVLSWASSSTCQNTTGLGATGMGTRLETGTGKVAESEAMVIDSMVTDEGTSMVEVAMVERWKFSDVPVVLDGSNICWRHGQLRGFSLGGALLAFRHFEQRGHNVLIFLPESRVAQVDLKEDAGTVRQDIGINEMRNDKWKRELEHLRQVTKLVVTPAGDYDDAYICDYARRHGAIVVSNDAYRDVVYQASADGHEKGQRWNEWLTACRMTFTFHGDEFLPNPAFHWERAARVAANLCSL